MGAMGATATCTGIRTWRPGLAPLDPEAVPSREGARIELPTGTTGGNVPIAIGAGLAARE